jgi:uncharacterized membrane protein
MLSRKVLIAVALLGIAHAVVTATLLPDKVAIHFGAGGRPNSWASNSTNLMITIGLHLFFLALFLLMPPLLRSASSKWINLPNREFWLAPERKERAIIRIASYLNVFGIGLLLFFLVLYHFVVQANLYEPPMLNERAVSIAGGCFLTFTGVWVIALYAVFKKQDE